MTEDAHGSEPAGRPATRIRVAQGLAFLALVSALVGALGPAERVRTTYSWPPATLPAETPERAWYTPLVLAAHFPDGISATVPCAPARRLSASATPTTVLATARYPERVGGLALRRSGERLEVRVGELVLTRVDVGTANLNGEECAYRIGLSRSRWRVERSGGEIAAEGELERPPVVTGLFSEVDLRSAGAPSIAVTTNVHATRTTTRQAVAWTLAAAAAVASLLLVAFRSRPRALRRTAIGAMRGVRRNANAADAFVVAVLALWWVISPAYIDDGWVTSRERMFQFSRGFSHYYSPFGVNLPLDYWVEWLHHWLSQSTPSLLWNRLPAVLCLAAIWVICRWMAARILQPGGVPLWTLATVFVAGALAWGVTLRPEPVTALFVTGVAACMIAFHERRSAAPLALAAAIVALAISAHTGGIVTLASFVVAAPLIARWLRPNAATATAVVAATLALLAVLLFVGSDLEQRRSDAQVVRTFASEESWRDELLRYSFLSLHHYGTPLRRVSVALLGLAALAFVLRRRRGPFTLRDFPAAALIAGLLLLVAIPSKWPSHFGTLIGLAAVAFACEAARVREEGARSSRWTWWPFVAVGAASGAVAWAFLEREQWNVVDLQTLDWELPVGSLAAAVPILGLVTVLVVARRRRSERAHAAPWRAAAWIGPLVVLPVLVYTTATIVVDTAATSSWTLGRQHLSMLTGADAGCGLGDALVVPRTESARGLAVARGSAAVPELPEWVPAPPAPGLARYALGPTTAGAASTPWFELPRDGRFGVFVSGVASRSDRLRLEWGGRAGNVFEPVESHPLDALPQAMNGDHPWRFIASGRVPTSPPSATAVRVILANDGPPAGALAVSAPVSYTSQRLTDAVARPDSPTLIHANLLLYFPCARLPLLARGLAEPPEYLVARRNNFGPFNYQATSSFLGTVDLYDLESLPIDDSDDPPADVLVYRVDRSIPGAVAVPPVAETS